MEKHNTFSGSNKVEHLKYNTSILFGELWMRQAPRVVACVLWRSLAACNVVPEARCDGTIRRHIIIALQEVGIQKWFMIALFLYRDDGYSARLNGALKWRHFRMRASHFDINWSIGLASFPFVLIRYMLWTSLGEYRAFVWCFYFCNLETRDTPKYIIIVLFIAFTLNINSLIRPNNEACSLTDSHQEQQQRQRRWRWQQQRKINRSISSTTK